MLDDDFTPPSELVWDQWSMLIFALLLEHLGPHEMTTMNSDCGPQGSSVKHATRVTISDMPHNKTARQPWGRRWCRVQGISSPTNGRLVASGGNPTQGQRWSVTLSHTNHCTCPSVAETLSPQDVPKLMCTPSILKIDGALKISPCGMKRILAFREQAGLLLWVVGTIQWLHHL